MRAVRSQGNKARPALPPAHPRLTSRLRLDALSGSGARSEFLAQLAGGLLLFTATPPHAGARTLTRTHLEGSAFAPESGLGSGPKQLAGGLLVSASPSARTHSASPRATRGGHLGEPLWGGHLAFVTFVLAFPGDARGLVRRPGLQRGAHSGAKSMSLSRLLRPLPYPSLHTWTQHTPSVLHARSFLRTWVTYCTWELHPARS